MILYKYYVNNIEVFPRNSNNLKYSFERQTESGLLLETKLESELLFDQVSGSFDFKAQEASNKWLELPFRVDQKCANNDYLPYFNGIFAVAEGFFDTPTCTYRIKPRPQTNVMLSDILVNMLETPTAQAVNCTTAARIYNNGRKFEDVLYFIAKKTNPNIVSIISNFFQINPLVVSAFCLPGVSNVFLKNMVFFALSEIQEPQPSDNATKAFVKWKDLMDDLNVMFDVFWYIDSGFNIRIEHRLFFEGVPGLDLTTGIYPAYVSNKNKYSYDLKEIPRQEVWKFTGSDQYAKLTYTDGGFLNKNTNVQEYTTKVIRTDYAKIRYVDGGSEEEGLFLFSTFLFYNMFESMGQNGKLTPAYLVKYIHTYSRPYNFALFDAINLNTLGQFFVGGGFNANSVKPTILQEELSFPICCQDEIDFKNQMTTEMGLGYLDKGSFETKTNLLKVNLKYKDLSEVNFLPSDFAGLRLWLRFNTGLIQVGPNVSQWTDQSGNGLHATQGVPTARPINSLGEISFQPNQYLKTPAFQLFPAKRGTLFVIFSVPNTTGGNTILSTENTNPGDIFWDISSAFTGLFNYGNFTPYLTNNNYNLGSFDGQKGLLIIRRIGDTSEENFHNGIKPYPEQNPKNIPNAQVSSNPLVLGANPDVGQSPNPITISEVIVYDTVLTDYELEKVEQYLSKSGVWKIYPQI